MYQLNAADAAGQKAVLHNMLNHMAAVSDGEFVVVIHNDAVYALQDVGGVPATNEVLDQLRAKGASVRICNNSLKGRNLDYHGLHGVAPQNIVLSGVAEVAYLEQQGYIYLHP